MRSIMSKIEKNPGGVNENWNEPGGQTNEVQVDLTSQLTRLTKRRLLTADEEKRLSARIQNGDSSAKDRLVEANMRLVINIAHHYHSCLVPFEDLVQEGAIGLMTAAERYDATRGYRFSTYATHWIRQSISRAIDNKAKPIRIPSHVSDTLRKLEKTRVRLLRELGEEPSPELLAQQMGMTVRKINALIQAGLDPISLDMLVGDDEGTTLASLLLDRTSPNPQDALLSQEMQAQLIGLLNVLTPREQEIMRLRLGFEEEPGQVLQEIGETMHISRERVRQIELQALKKLKYAAKRSDLLAYMAS